MGERGGGQNLKPLHVFFIYLYIISSFSSSFVLHFPLRFFFMFLFVFSSFVPSFVSQCVSSLFFIVEVLLPQIFMFYSFRFAFP